jgi:16S rRNA (cytidine1402-2'-O)-methyltransferase
VPERPDAATATSGQAGGTLFVVATPIGNLGDITLRALDVLRSVAVVAAEDTRLTRRLWDRHGLVTPLVSYHAHSDPARTRELLARLSAGDDVALVTDAGTPLVSDPGGDLVARWLELQGSVVPIPGPSAVLAALVGSGIPAPRWTFEGFLPRRGRERTMRLARIGASDRATVLFEAPARTAATLRDLAAACGEDRRAALCRELTKRF